MKNEKERKTELHKFAVCEIQQLTKGDRFYFCHASKKKKVWEVKNVNRSSVGIASVDYFNPANGDDWGYVQPFTRVVYLRSTN
jgi:hypothetical protein